MIGEVFEWKGKFYKEVQDSENSSLVCRDCAFFSERQGVCLADNMNNVLGSICAADTHFIEITEEEYNLFK